MYCWCKFPAFGWVTETIKDTSVSIDEAEKHNEQSTIYNMPMELLELIISRLTLEENLRASVVCKRWLKAAISVRVADKPPWLMLASTCDDDLIEFYDPRTRKSYWLDLPELRGCRACHTRDGWLLLYSFQTQSISLLSPYTRELIKLPTLELASQVVAFSAAPTTTSCIVLTIKNISRGLVAISTWRPGGSEWTTVNFQNRLPFVSSTWNKLVCCNGLFYFLSLTGWLGVYNPEEQSWVIRTVPPPECRDFIFAKNWWKGRFMAEHHGDLYIMYTAPSVNPVIYKLDQINEVWEEMKSLGGLTIFGNTILGSSLMIGVNRIPLNAFGSNHLKTFQSLFKIIAHRGELLQGVEFSPASRSDDPSVLFRE
ncbi:hypothetical protein Leryth_021656 [Lithospermum erythrorhizon]|nr:hypothetical protein Leryth_021656 [Lithospermum erythrorhizon]